MTRKEVREQLFQLVFELCFVGAKNEMSLSLALEKIDSDVEKKYLSDVYLGIADKYDELTKLICSKAQGFALDRIFKVDLAIMLVALYEIKYYNIPTAVAVNEAVNLAKKYSTEKSANFVNGVLAGLVN